MASPHSTKEAAEPTLEAEPPLAPGVPWDDPGGRAVRAFGRTLWGCLRHPMRFFARVGEREERWGAVGYALVMDVLGFSLAALWTAAFEGGLEGIELVSLVLSPVRVLVSVWLGSEMMHGVLRLLRGAARPRAVTHRAVAYCYSTAAFALVPVHGLRVGLALAAVYQVIALRQAHRTAWWKAVAAVLVTWAALLGMILLASFSGQEPAPEGG